jgi:hypothetical protein
MKNCITAAMLMLCCLSLPMLSGCSAYAPRVVVTEAGVQNSNTTQASTINLFNEHYNQLYEQELSTAQENIRPVKAIDLTAEGASLSYQFCSSFFKRAGTEQQYLLFSRDVIGVIGTLATGVLGATHASPAATASVGITSGALLSGISAYSRNFLFSEDNVQAVQDLTLRAMASQTAATLARARGLDPNYQLHDAVKDIMDIQAICEVQNILSLVGNSIHQAELVSSVSSGGQVSTDVVPRRGLTIVGLNTTSAAVFLQNQALQNPGALLAAIRRAAPELSFRTSSDAVTWTFNPKSDRQQLEAVAKTLGWSEQ